MCWKYEDKYPGRCLDGILSFDRDMNCCITRGLDMIDILSELGIDVDRSGALEGEFLDFLTKMHDKGLIKPLCDKEAEEHHKRLIDWWVDMKEVLSRKSAEEMIYDESVIDPSFREWWNNTTEGKQATKDIEAKRAELQKLNQKP